MTFLLFVGFFGWSGCSEDKSPVSPRPGLRECDRPQRTRAAVYTNDFEGAVGSEWSNTSTNTTPVGARRFLGQFSNQTVSLTLTGLPPHEKVSVLFDLYIIRTWDGNRTDYGPDIWDLSVGGGPTLLHTTFINIGPASSYRQAYPDPFPGGSNPPRTCVFENNALGYTPDAVYRLEFDFPHSTGSLVLNFSASRLQPLWDESWGIDNVRVAVEADVE